MELDVAYKGLDGGAYDVNCSHMFLSDLMNAAKTSLCDAVQGYTPAGNQYRLGQEMLKNCIDAINNNNAQVIPSTPRDYSSASVACGQ
jgi:hypothetical protein